ncbi:acetylornithine deacetylase/succinyldiaminopimelate desuccinylase-like deacylase [Halogeometricum borinquense DSM 11551]|uniref:Acetylornithine deacetylase/succinyldiaminopimelate desuccinylase-like deacylase n=2 Tax=Halogeometricum borinquense TaxID=60847 RepID=E4NLF4_HALBP|nr:M20/M25/M40 family metallo-hydrolase [Halogeometricum borinquense]ADQ66050.1 acetylornithine deacetylase/succinyldiaminopimelate desuccinylase-like deacylase [Halogeometricum borinquense DSM 11551]ELY27453.1 acetylornithine deacetylase/succinyldiaminopimelate desuccinylase-like deacylase [Halogeometricum borinquense DSM 11551]RYJ13777.1 M20/M25/M40 family metallo-hydrolase [Halogeometricum borinquense]
MREHSNEVPLTEFVDRFLRFETTDGDEAEAQSWLRDQFEAFGFDTYEWTADADRLASHPSFPDDSAEIRVADRPSVAGVVTFGDPDAGPTLVLNGHCDVVPVDRENWSSDPFDPVWSDGEVTARGAADMKSGLAACVFAVRDLQERVGDGELDGLDGRVVVESVVGEEEGGIGAAAAALDNPYPFDRDAAIVAEPTELRCVTATEGTVMKRLRLRGRAAHAATRWNGEDVLPHFERIRKAFFELESERSESVSHPLYDAFPIPWPVCIGTVRAGSWASSVAGTLTAECRFGVAPGETVDEVEEAYEARLAEVVAESDWLSEQPPTFERFSIQFEPAEIDADEDVVRSLQTAMGVTGHDTTDPVGATYGADSRHYVAAGIPTVLYGPGSIEQAHFPDETINWDDVETARETYTEAAAEFLLSG